MSFRVGIVGCGAISGIYFENLAKFAETKVVACADLEDAKAHGAAQKYGCQVLSTKELLDNPNIDCVLNLTVPKAHFEISQLAIQKNKHLYVEKPLTIGLEDAKSLIAEAEKRNLCVGCAPDTVLGAGIQTCRELIQSGVIGEVIGGNAFMLCPGHESWHPSPEFYYEIGGGPMFDMGPYYLSALLQMLGQAESVFGSAFTPRKTRTITSQPKHGKTIHVETPTHIISVIRFKNGASIQFTASFDVQASTLPHIEIYGSEGTLLIPDPNGFGGEIKLKRKGQPEWECIEHTFPHAENSRGLGVRDMALAIEENRQPRASGRIALHVLEIMHATLISSDRGERINLLTHFEEPTPMPKL